MNSTPTTWSVAMRAMLPAFPENDSWPFDLEHQVAEAGGVGPSVTISQDGKQASVRFFVDGVSPDNVFQQALEIFSAVLPVGAIMAVEAMTEAELDRELAKPAFPELAGPQELAKRLGISRQRLYEVMKMPGFPSPVVTLAAGPVWLTESVNNFVATWPRRQGRPPKSPTQMLKEKIASGANPADLFPRPGKK